MVWKCLDVDDSLQILEENPTGLFFPYFFIFACSVSFMSNLFFVLFVFPMPFLSLWLFACFVCCSLSVGVLCLSCTPVVGNPLWKHQKLSQMSKNQKRENCCECLINDLSGFEVQLLKIKTEFPFTLCLCDLFHPHVFVHFNTVVLSLLFKKLQKLTGAPNVD